LLEKGKKPMNETLDNTIVLFIIAGALSVGSYFFRRIWQVVNEKPEPNLIPSWVRTGGEDYLNGELRCYFYAGMFEDERARAAREFLLIMAQIEAKSRQPAEAAREFHGNQPNYREYTIKEIEKIAENQSSGGAKFSEKEVEQLRAISKQINPRQLAEDWRERRKREFHERRNREKMFLKNCENGYIEEVLSVGTNK